MDRSILTLSSQKVVVHLLNQFLLSRQPPRDNESLLTEEYRVEDWE